MALLLRTKILSAAVVATGWASASPAQNFVASDEQVGETVKVELFQSSRLGCGERTTMLTAASGTQCAFDNATRGARFSARHELGSASLEAYGAVGSSTIGAFAPEQLLLAPQHRTSEATNFFMLGLKGNALDGRLKVSAEFASTERVVDMLKAEDWATADITSRRDSSASVSLDTTLADRPGLKWSLTGEYRSAIDGYSTGRSRQIFSQVAVAGSRLALSSRARIGQLGVSAGVEQNRTPFGQSASKRFGIDFWGLALGLRSRTFRANPWEASTLLESQTSSQVANIDVDTTQLASSLLPDLTSLPFIVPTNISVSHRSAETHNRFDTGLQRYRRSSLGIDGGWETPIGETDLSYWRDRRTALTDAVSDQSSETAQISHMVRRGHWRFGLDASVARMSGGSSGGYSDSSLSFGQSVAYSAPGGPEFRLHLGQDRSAMRQDDDSFVMDDSYSSITASLDLSRYLQQRFERPDLRLTLDYRKAVDRSESEMSLYEETIDRWVDDDRREGVLVSFGMKL
jgi:hypothetical protein